MCAPPGGNRHVRVRGVAGRRSDLRLGWKLVAAAAWSILDRRVRAPRVSSRGSGCVWVGLGLGRVDHSTLLGLRWMTVTSPSAGWPIRGLVYRRRPGGLRGAERIEEPWECRSGSSLIAPPNRCFDAGPRVLEPYTWVRYRPLARSRRTHHVEE